MINYEKRLNILSMLSIILYVLILVWALYFKFGDISDVTYHASELSKMTFKERFLFDIIPFDFSNTHQKFLHFVLNILNMIVFIPLGVALSMMDKKIKLKKHALICFLISLAFELLQLFTLIGGFASDDLLMNTLGYFAGAAIYYFLFRKFSDKVNYYIMIACNIILIIFTVVAIISVAPIFDQYIQVIKDYAFK